MSQEPQWLLITVIRPGKQILPKQNNRGTHREYSSKPLKHSIFERILVFKPCMYMYVCIPNWPLPIGAFQDQCKQIVINKHIKVKNPNWREADQLAIYKRRREVELGATKNNIS